MTVRYRASSRYTYARALLELVTFARAHAIDFEFGPLDLAALEHNGLAISGPDLSPVEAVLRNIPGLILVDNE